MDPWSGLELDPPLLVVITTGLPLADGPVALQLLWLLALVLGAGWVLRAHRAGIDAPTAS